MQTQSIQPLTQAISIMRSDENITTTSRGMLVLQIMEKVEQAAEGKSAELISALCESLRAIIRLVLPAYVIVLPTCGRHSIIFGLTKKTVVQLLELIKVTPEALAEADLALQLLQDRIMKGMLKMKLMAVSTQQTCKLTIACSSAISMREKNIIRYMAGYTGCFQTLFKVSSCL